jgi:DNA-binding NtrC family response regulator
MPSIRLTDEAMEIAKGYYWRGNVRQLKNVVDQISIIEQHRDITPEILANYLPKNEQSTGLVAVHSQSNSYAESQNIEMLKQIVFSLSKELETLKKQVQEMNTSNRILIDRVEEIEEQTSIPVEVKQSEIEDVVTETEIEDVTPVETTPTVIKTKVDRDREAIEEALKASGGNRKVAADMLGISERTLYRKLKGEN